MMKIYGTPGAENLQKAVKKCLVGMAFLLVFLPQLSYKFYLCANPGWKTFTHGGLSRAQEQNLSRTIGTEHCRHLSVDKRYGLKYFPVLLPFQIDLVSRTNGQLAYTAERSSPFSSPDGLCPSLRGPPFA